MNKSNLRPHINLFLFTFLDQTKIFEFDKRFESFGKDFQFYDYSKAEEENYLSEYEKKFDIIIADPPFLSEECLHKTSIIIKKIMKDNSKIILNTGSVQSDHAKKYLNLSESSYKPQHKNNLGNEFSCFSNFDLDSYM
jgi:EEF1A lysine methyltransferase 1